MKSLHYEEFNVGDKFRTVGRTIDQADITIFANLSGVHHQLHTNEEYSKNGPLGRRVAHGILTLAITSGLVSSLGIFVETGLANLGSTEKYMLPVFSGDTIHAEIEIMAKKAMGKQRGMITARINTVNQKKEIVLTQEMNGMVRCAD